MDQALIPTIEDRIIPDQWDYEKSVSTTKTLIYHWKNMTADILHEIWTAWAILTKQPFVNVEIVQKWTNYTFGGYCQDIGIAKQTAYNWLSRLQTVDA